MMNRQKLKIAKRIRRHNRVRATVIGSAERPRLAIFRANSNTYAQIIDDQAHKTLVSVSSLNTKFTGKKTEQASQIGSLLAQKALEQKIIQVVFDRGGYKYHGRVKALAEAAREAGLKF